MGFIEALRFWVKLGFVNFGGPTGQIAIMHHELVERRRWISEPRFLHALNFCMLLPGPEAQQLAIYVGWLLHGVPGGLVAGSTFVLPAAALMLGLSWLYAVHGDVALVEGLFGALAAAVVGIVGAAVIRIGGRALRSRALTATAALAFVGIFVVGVPFPVIVLAAGLAGLLGAGLRPAAFGAAPEAGAAEGDGDGPDDAPRGRQGLLRAARVLAIGLAVWWLPLLAVLAVRGSHDVLAREGLFFGRVAVVTFGGAYAVLAYVDQAAVTQYGWLTSGEMAAGLGLAESTPGPLIIVTQFVGFLAAYRFPGGLDPLLAGVLGSLVTIWAVFVPSFLWIFLGAPWIERLRGNVRLAGALATITAAVVGVILNLALSFGVHALFREVDVLRPFSAPIGVPVLPAIDPLAAVVALASFVGIWRLRWGVVPVVLASAAAGLLRAAVAG